MIPRDLDVMRNAGLWLLLENCTSSVYVRPPLFGCSNIGWWRLAVLVQLLKVHRKRNLISFSLAHSHLSALPRHTIGATCPLRLLPSLASFHFRITIPVPGLTHPFLVIHHPVYR